MNIWKLWIRGPKWCAKWLKFHWVPDQVCGIIYAGVTVCGVSLIYSDYWAAPGGGE